VAIASEHLDNPEGFCQLRHMDATGEPAGKASGEKADKSVVTALKKARQILKYSEDEARDENGRFASGGGSGSGSGGGGNAPIISEPGDAMSRLSPELQQLAANEARDIFVKSNANEGHITEAIKQIADKTGGKAYKIQYRVKTEKSLQSKIARDVQERCEKTGEKPTAAIIRQAAAEINDAVRFTIVYKMNQLTPGVGRALDGMKAAGFEQITLNATIRTTMLAICRFGIAL
jgi:hypothetical protein